MKKIILSAGILFSGMLSAQNSVPQLLNAGIEDAVRFSDTYISPAAEGAMYSINNGWYNTAEAQDVLSFEISIMAHASFVKDENQYFDLNTNDYNFIRFEDGPGTQRVATAFGENDPNISVFVDYETPQGTQSEEIVLPQGLGAASLNFVPSAFLQGSIGVFEGTEIKARYSPKIDYDGVEAQLYGGAIQHEITSWLFNEKVMPIALSGLIGYTKFKGNFDLDDSVVAGDNQRIETEMNTWMFSAIASTKLPIINFYVGLNYLTGTSETGLLGRYEVDSGPLQGQALVDPYRIDNSISGASATLGTKLSLSFFRLNVAYSFQQYDHLSVGINFGI